MNLMTLGNRGNLLFNDFGRIFELDKQTMKVDIQELDNKYYLEAELPGVKKEDINVEFRDNQLKIQVKSENQKEDKGENYIRKERYSQYMSRSFVFDDANNEEINAKYEDGILKLEIPKKESLQRKIDIN